jgi:hypothetical protein
MWVNEYPVVDVSPKLYPPPALRPGIVSGLHCSIPNGTSAPGNVFPPPVVHVRVSTSAAGAVTDCATRAWFFAPVGSFDAGTGAGQWTGRPGGPLVHAAGEGIAASGTFVGTLELGLGTGLWPGAAAAGAALKVIAPPRRAAATNAIVIRHGDG